MTKKRLVICIVLAIVVIGVAAGIHLEMKQNTGNAVSKQAGGESETETTEPACELTEEEIEILESQEGVTVSEDGTMEIDVSSNMAQ